MYTIKNFRKYVRPAVLARAKEYLDSGKISQITQLAPGCYHAEVKGTHSYGVEIDIDGSGNIIQAECTCPYGYGGLCKHIAAVLMAIEKEAKVQLESMSSYEAHFLIDNYKKELEGGEKTETALSAEIRLQPFLYYDTYNRRLEAFLKIGNNKMYKVRDIGQLYVNFLNEEYAGYGKFLAFTHRLSVLDERGQKLLKIIGPAYVLSNRRFGGNDSVSLAGMYLDDFFELYRDDYVMIDDEQYLVKFENPAITLVLKRDGKKRFRLKTDLKYNAAGAGRRSYFLDGEEHKVFAASAKFTRSVYQLCRIAQGVHPLFISEADMPEFYTAVLKPALDYVQIDGIELISDLIPPEMTAQLYVDCGESNTVYADLMFCYNDKTYNAFAGQNAPHYDQIGESAAKSAVLRYFAVCPGRDRRTLMIAGDDEAYAFITSGLTELSQTMELYVSEKFRRMAVRPPAKPKIGVRVSGGLLELDIEDDNYSGEELAEILKAYRLGVKYRRLKDGSFAVIDDAAAQLGELAENLDLTDKDLLKKKLKIPAYRMLYLDSLQNRGSIRMRYSKEFRESVSDYHKSIENAEGLSVPDELSDIMRDYQKYGFRWLKTIAGYKFGGILADDMGLGKTIQAISLILDTKQRNEKQLPALIVCPSSLTLNWEAEIERFAPSLKTLVVIGTSAARSALMEKFTKGGFDVMITSYSLITRDVDSYADLKFGLQFIDEAQYIKNHGTQAAKAVKAINSEVRFALTGTPVENSLAELWSAFDFIMPGYLFSYARFKSTYEIPIAGKNDKEAVKALQNSTAPFILRRMKKDVLAELPDKTETVLSAEMEKEQRKLYAANVSQLQKSIKNGLGAEQKDRIQILAALTRLRQICCDPALVYDDFKGKSAKLEQCAELAESCVNSGHKILLFSQFTSMLDIISKRLEQMRISYYTLRGSTRAKDRIRMVNEFNENDVNVFLISLKAGGTGLNLTGADIVIHYDPWWNVSAENQASDRAYRIGQKNNVQIYKLITRNSIEENIIKLQQSKSELGNLIYGESSDITKMSADEILELLK